MADVNWFFRKGWLAGNSLSEDEIPSDPAIPLLRELLDASAMKPHLEEALRLSDPTAPKRVLNQRVASVAYRPGRECRVNYCVEVAHRRMQTTEQCLIYAKSISIKRARLREDNDRGGGRGRGLNVAESRQPSHFPLDQGQTNVSVFPNDLRLTGLREFVQPSDFCAVADKTLCSRGLKTQNPEPGQNLMQIVSYRPERHCLIRIPTQQIDGDLSSKQSTFARLYRDDRGAKVFQIMKLLWQNGGRKTDGQNQPEPLAYDHKRQILYQSEISGRPLAELTDQHNFLEDIGRTGRMLADFHGCQINQPGEYPRRSGSNQIRWLAKNARGLKRVSPRLGTRLQILADRLHASIPLDEPAFQAIIHGDFSLNQVLAGGGRAGLIDLDDACIGDLHADIGTCLARMYSSIASPALRHKASEVLLDHYQSAKTHKLEQDRIDWHCALALTRLGLSRLSQLRSGWRKQTEHFFDLAHSLTSR